jgi:hypothetical protein
MESDERVVVQDFREAERVWKEWNRRGDRAGMFYWNHEGECERRHASGGYPLSTDYGE